MWKFIVGAVLVISLAVCAVDSRHVVNLEPTGHEYTQYPVAEMNY